MERKYIFSEVGASPKTLETLYLHLLEGGKLWWNIDTPTVTRWEQESPSSSISLFDSFGCKVGVLHLDGDQPLLHLNNKLYFDRATHDLFAPSNSSSLLESFPRLDIRSVHVNPDNDICAGLSFGERASICWFNRSSPIHRRLPSPFSTVVGEKTAITDKWESIFRLAHLGLPSPDVYLLYLQDAYVLNGSLVFTSAGELVGCTEQLGFTLGPWTNYSSSLVSDSDEIRFLKSLSSSPESPCPFNGSIKALDERTIVFLYSQCHTGFGHHLGQSTPSSYFIDLIHECDPHLASKLLCLYRGGLHYEAFRKDIYRLSLDFVPPVCSITSGLVRVPKLIVPSSLSNYGNHWAGFSDVYTKIRNRAQKLSTISDLKIGDIYSGIYLSRKGYNRGCSNPAEVSELLRKLRFLEYSPPGSLSIIDQIALVSHFDLVFAPYGSGANNIVFARDNSHLVQPLCSLSDGQSWDYSSAQMVGADYTYIFSHPDNPGASFHEKTYTYDLDTLGDVIRGILRKD